MGEKRLLLAALAAMMLSAWLSPLARADFTAINTFTFSGNDSSGQLHSASVEFDAGTNGMSGNNAGQLRVILSNTYSAASNFEFQQTDVLGGLFFKTSSGITLSAVTDSAAVTAGSQAVQGTTTGVNVLPFTDVSYSWAYKNGTEFGSTYNNGIGSVGFNTFGPGDLFNTGTPPSGYPTNGTQPDGVDWGEIPLNTTNFSHDGFIGNGYGFVQSSTTFVLNGWDPSQDTGNDITAVLFQYGTDTSEFSGQGTSDNNNNVGVVPAPPSAILLGIGAFAIALAGQVRRRFLRVAA
jgi:hypothetical protein